MSKLCFGCMQQKEVSPICEHCGFDERTENLSHQLPIGTLLQNQYLVGRVLGQGGFGITYMGWDQHLSIPVAIKEYFPGGVVQRHTQLSTKVSCVNGEAPEIFAKHRERFLKEARTLAQLSGIPEIVQIRSFFPENGTAYIVMEYVEGITLKEHLKGLGRPMTEGEALTVMEPVLKALQKVHDHGLIHRDISPDNIMLPVSGGVKLIDFGTVRYMDDSGKSKSTEAVLKAGFAPMEQYNTRGNLGTWTDVYAVSATFHYLLTGKVPADVHDRMEQGESLTLLRSRDGISKKLIQVLEKGMKLRVQDRVQTIEELYRLLYAGKKKSPAPKQPETEKEAIEKKAKGKGGLLAVCAAAAVAVGAAALLLIPRNQEPEVSLAVPETTETVAQYSTEAATTEAMIPETEETVAPNVLAYAEAEQLLADRQVRQAAIAFGKLIGYRDARERSMQLWESVADRKTIGAAYHHTVAVKNDGTVLATGNNDFGQCDVSGWTDIVAIAAGGRFDVTNKVAHTVGLKSDGTVVAVGCNDVGQCDVSAWRDIVAIAAGGEHTVGLKADGTVVVTGKYFGFGHADDFAAWQDIVAISADSECTMGLRSDGTVVTASDGKFGYDEANNWTGIIAIDASTHLALGVKADGTALSAGMHIWDECFVTDWSGVIATSGGLYHSLGLCADGTVVAAGRNFDSDKVWAGQCDVSGWKNITDICAGKYYSIGLRADGTLVATGKNVDGACDVSGWRDIRQPN